ncbi:MAG: helix-turn-helix transcriptional regulator [Bacteroidales bacterium]|nr:helix-turn-helix transcriptional regulator [Bacteroidales bacterium]
MNKLADFLSDIGKIKIPAEGGIAYLETTQQLTRDITHVSSTLPFYSFSLIFRGRVKILYDGKEWDLPPNHLYTYTPGLDISIIDVSDDFLGLNIFVEEGGFLEAPVMRNMIRAAYFPFVELHEPCLQLTEAQAHLLTKQMLVIKEHQAAAHRFKAEVMRTLYSAFLLDLIDILESTSCHRHTSERTEKLFVGFMRLLSHHYIEHHDISFYASELCVTPIYLSRIVRQITGRTVVYYINQMLLMEASWLLRNTDETTVQIADRLHFSSQASFSRFFTRMKGITPKAYRSQQ